MSERIKTALEKALERVSKMEINDDDLACMERMDTGRILASRYLRDSSLDLKQEVGDFKPETRSDAVAGIEEILLRSIALPADDYTQQLNQRALDGLSIIKKDRQALQAISGELGYLFSYYVQAYRHTYTNVKEQLQQRISAAQQTLQQQTGMRMSVDAERLPEFRMELNQAIAGLNAQYEALLKEQKERLRDIPRAF